jgi:hypothetical protein
VHIEARRVTDFECGEANGVSAAINGTTNDRTVSVPSDRNSTQSAAAVLPDPDRSCGHSVNAGGLREIRAVIVAVDSAMGLGAQAIDDLSAHLPPQHAPRVCPLCSTQPWPCSRFRAAAHHVHACGVNLTDLVPLDLHPHLWPPEPCLDPPPAPDCS